MLLPSAELEEVKMVGISTRCRRDSWILLLKGQKVGRRLAGRVIWVERADFFDGTKYAFPMVVLVCPTGRRMLKFPSLFIFIILLFYEIRPLVWPGIMHAIEKADLCDLPLCHWYYQNLHHPHPRSIKWANTISFSRLDRWRAGSVCRTLRRHRVNTRAAIHVYTTRRGFPCREHANV